jgi:hypothetical protein
MTYGLDHGKMGHMAGTDRPAVYRFPPWVWVLWIVVVAVVAVDFFVRRGVMWTLVLIAGSAALSVPVRRMVRRT